MGEKTILLTVFLVGSILIGCVANNRVILSALNPVTVELPDCRSVFSRQEAEEQSLHYVGRWRGCGAAAFGVGDLHWQVYECIKCVLEEHYVFLSSLQLYYCPDLSLNHKVLVVMVSESAVFCCCFLF